MSTVKAKTNPVSAHSGELNRQNFSHRVAIVVGVVKAVGLALIFVYYLADVLLIAFAGLLLAIFLRGLTNYFSHLTGIPAGWSLAIVGVALLVLVGGGGWLLAPDLTSQLAQLSMSLPESIEQLRQRLQQYSWSEQFLSELPSMQNALFSRLDILSRATGLVSRTLGLLTNLALILFIGIYVAVNPTLYKEGLLKLIPADKRPRAREVLHDVGHTLERWLIGRSLSMLVIGVLTTIGLQLIGVPLALTLGLLAAILSFIPYIGPILSVIPPALLAFSESSAAVIYVGLLYLAIQLFESYLLTPLIQKRAVNLPPALTITWQVALSVLVGFTGLVLATPLVATIFVLVKRLYIEDVLHDR